MCQELNSGPCACETCAVLLTYPPIFSFKKNCCKINLTQNFHINLFYNKFYLCFEMRSCYVAQAVLKLLDSSDPPTSASQVLVLQAHISELNYL
jgi:hypothetical protein